MDDEIVIIDQTYKYEVDEILNGGIGYVRLMTLKEISRRPPDSERLHENPEGKYPYRNQLAAKTIKYKADMSKFAKACELWCGLNAPGITPLLKTVKIGDEILALMPRYAGNLRTLLQIDKHSLTEMLKALHPVIVSLSNMDEDQGIVHQAIKPENILYCYHNQKLVLELSDWGIADVQASLLPFEKSERIKALVDFGMVPYIAPERFDNYISNFRADIFSLGMVFFEFLTGCLPYKKEKTIAEQIATGEYYDNIETMLRGREDIEVNNLLLRMLHPEADKRLGDYEDILALIGGECI